MFKNNKIIFLSFSILIIAIVLSLFISIYALPKRLTRIDQSQHFYDMKKWYESKKFPVTSARFLASQVVNEEFSTPRVPGGAFYIFYTFFYKLSGENLFLARVFNFIFNSIIIYLFLLWIYKKFGFFIMGVISALVLCNGYLIAASTDFWNPNITLIFSFIFFIFLYEYIGNKNELITKISAILIFPILAIMAQGHFVTFFSMIPTVILYLVIKHKRTFKYALYWVLGVFISFLEYLPYIVNEVQNSFNNNNLIFSAREQIKTIPFPQIHALALFPTNEMSVFYGNSIYATFNFWFSNPQYIFGFIFLLLSIAFSFLCITRATYFVFNKKYVPSSEVEKTLIEILKIFFLFIPVTIIVNILAGSKPGTFHYLYSAFALSFTPIIFFFVQNQSKIKLNNKLIYFTTILLVLNMLAMTGQLTRYFRNYEEPKNQNGMKMVANTLLESSEEKEIRVTGVYDGYHDYMYRDIAVAYFPDLVWKQNNNSTNADLYIVLDKTGTFSRPKKTVEEYMKYFNSNSILLSNNSLLFVYKYTGKEPPLTPKKK